MIARPRRTEQITLHIVGEGAKGERILRAMLERQERGVFPNGGGFQNGVVLLREAAFRAQVLCPLQ